jgi:hypothetical protein
MVQEGFLAKIFGLGRRLSLGKRKDIGFGV